jgi:hypothetical protein
MSEIIRPKTTARPTRSFYDLGNHIIIKPYSSMVRVSVTNMDSGDCVIVQCAFDQWKHEYVPSTDMYEALPIEDIRCSWTAATEPRREPDLNCRRLQTPRVPRSECSATRPATISLWRWTLPPANEPRKPPPAPPSTVVPAWWQSPPAMDQDHKKK